MESLSFLFLVFTALLFVGGSFGKDKEKESSNIQKIKDKLKSGAEKLDDIKKKVVPARFLPKEVHPTEWDKLADGFVDQLKTSLISTCVPGVRLQSSKDAKSKEVLTLSKGKLTGINYLYHRTDAKVLSEKGDTAEIEYTLAFKNLKIEYNYEYEAKKLIFNLNNRKGPVTIQVNGVTLFSVVLSIKKPSGTNAQDKNQRCYITVNSMKVKDLPSTVRMLRVHSNNVITRTFYFIFKFINLTVRGVTSSVKVVQQQLIQYVGEALEDVVGKSVKNLKGVCPGAANTRKPPRNCKAIKAMQY